MIKLKGTKFQLKVWKYLTKIPIGETRTYLDIAKALKRPNSYRSIANIIGKNPHPIKIPCHRVIRSNGKLGGYSGPGGIETKKKLLKKEGFCF